MKLVLAEKPSDGYFLGGCGQKAGLLGLRKEQEMYSKEQREKALALYDKCHSITKVIQILGYPESRQGLYLWFRERNAAPKKKAERRRVNNSPDHPLHPPLETKAYLLQRVILMHSSSKCSKCSLR